MKSWILDSALAALLVGGGVKVSAIGQEGQIAVLKWALEA
jgi:hypothetical protein